VLFRSIRGNVLKALYNLGFTDIASDLIEMIRSQDNFMKASGLWVVSKVKVASKDIEDGAGICLLSDNEMVCTNARKALSTMSTPRALGYLKYLDEPVKTASPAPSPAPSVPVK
jgi:hypothetical protein